MLRRVKGRLGTVLLGVGLYATVGVTAAGVQAIDPADTGGGACPAELLSPAEGADAGGITILQGNFWMLPTRLLIVPYPFSTDRAERLERLIGVVARCRPTVVTLQEVFDQSMVDALAASLPDYRLITSGQTGFMGHFNVSGLVTLVRVPVVDTRFQGFRELPPEARTIERLSGKGFLATEIDGPGFRGTVVNLHLYAPQDGGEAALARAQLAEAVAFARNEELRGRRVLLTGDFNLPRSELERLLPAAWALSAHGPTYDPLTNPYTVEGANGGLPWNQSRGAPAEDARTIDFLVAPRSAGVRVRSRVLGEIPLSDHHFLAHAVAAAP